jgi:hypothetical protein
MDQIHYIGRGVFLLQLKQEKPAKRERELRPGGCKQEYPALPCNPLAGEESLYRQKEAEVDYPSF